MTGALQHGLDTTGSVLDPYWASETSFPIHSQYNPVWIANTNLDLDKKKQCYKVLGPVVQSIVSLTKSLVNDSLSSSAPKIKCANNFC